MMLEANANSKCTFGSVLTQVYPVLGLRPTPQRIIYTLISILVSILNSALLIICMRKYTYTSNGICTIIIMGKCEYTNHCY